MELSDFRLRLDRIDDEMVALILERMAISREIGEYKKEKGIAVFDPAREAQIIAKRRGAAANENDAEAIERLYRLIFELSRAAQEE